MADKNMEKRKGKSKDKRGIALETLGWWIMALVILVLVILGYFILKGKGISALDYIKDLFRFK